MTAVFLAFVVFLGGDPAPDEGPARAQKAVDRALAYLAKRQAEEPDGSISLADAQKPAPVGITALAALAFLGGGGAGQGPYAENAARAIDYLLSRADATTGYIHEDQDPNSKMHGHGYATLALAQAYGMLESRRGKDWSAALHKKLGAAVRLIESTQGESGGWFYDPRREIQHEGSVTVVLVEALRAARDAGVQVDKKTIDRAVDYVRRLQKQDGSFRYQLGSEESTASLTAAGIATLQASGVYEGPSIAQGIDFLLRHFEKQKLRSRSSDPEPFPEYGLFYTAQALYLHRDPKLWQDWFPQAREQILENQHPDGSWGGSEFGSAYATAMHSLVLEIPFHYLPIFQR